MIEAEAHFQAENPNMDFEEVWKTFLSLPSTLGLDSGIRAKWHKGRTRYAAWLFRIKDEAVLRRMRDSHSALISYCSALKENEAHITLFVAGFPAACSRFDDDVDERLLDEQCDTFTNFPPAAPQFEIGALNAFASCAFLEVRERGHQMETLRRSLSKGSREIRFDSFKPHITIARFTSSFSAEQVASRILPYRNLPALYFRPDYLELVEFGVEADAPLETRFRVPMM